MAIGFPGAGGTQHAVRISCREPQGRDRLNRRAGDARRPSRRKSSLRLLPRRALLHHLRLASGSGGTSISRRSYRCWPPARSSSGIRSLRCVPSRRSLPPAGVYVTVVLAFEFGGGSLRQRSPRSRILRRASGELRHRRSVPTWSACGLAALALYVLRIVKGADPRWWLQPAARSDLRSKANTACSFCGRVAGRAVADAAAALARSTLVRSPASQSLQSRLPNVPMASALRISDVGTARKAATRQEHHRRVRGSSIPADLDDEPVSVSRFGLSDSFGFFVTRPNVFLVRLCRARFSRCSRFTASTTILPTSIRS